MPCNRAGQTSDITFMELFGLLGRKWTVIIILSIGNYNGIRFNKLRAEVDGASPKTLSRTLCELCDIGLVKMVPSIGPPLVMEYILTEEGYKLRNALLPTVSWLIENSTDCVSRGVRNALSPCTD